MKLAEIFQDGMILQRGIPIQLWGETEHGGTLTVQWNGALCAQAEAAPGSFAVTLPAMPAQENGTLTLHCSAETYTLRNVDVGEVWIAGGQSNMEFALRFDAEADDALAAAPDEHLRYYEVGKFCFAGEREEKLKDASRWFRWLADTPQNVPYFSAVGLYFARSLRRALGVPVGIVGCNWGGTQAIAWTDAAYIRRTPSLLPYLQVYESAAAKLDMAKYAAQNKQMRAQEASLAVQSKQEKIMKIESTTPPNALTRLLGWWFKRCRITGPHDENRPGGLFDTMVRPIAGFACRGVLWYQGESDERRVEQYTELFTGVIESWRRAWNAPLPFLCVQVAPFEAWQGCTGKRFPQIRAAQQTVADTVSGVYMTITMDVGSRYDIHPKCKRPVGERLSLLVQEKVYGLPVNGTCPRVQNIRRTADALILHWQNTAGGLQARPGLEELFRVCADGKPVAVTAQIEGDTIYLHGIRTTAQTITVAFADSPYCEMKLCGADGLPAVPFAEREV